MPDCVKCRKAIDDTPFCPYCGAKQEKQPRKTRTHGNGQGSVYKYRGGWCAQITVATESVIDDSGKPRIRRKYKTKYGLPTAREARAHLAAMLAELHSPVEQVRHVATLSELYDGYYNSAMQRVSKSTQTAYRIAWDKRIKPTLGDLPVDRLTVSSIDKLVSPLSYDTAKDVKDLLSVLCKRAMADNLILSNPTQLVTLPEQRSASVVPWSSDEVASLWRAYADGDRTASACLLMIYTGMMPGELFALEADMIDYNAHTIIGCGLKTKKRKEAPIIFPDFIVPVLRDLASTSTSRIGRVLGVNSDRFYKDFAALKSRLGIRPAVRPYSGRHSTHTQLAQHGVAPSLIVEIMRHKDYRTALEHYNEQDTGALVAALNSLEISSGVLHTSAL